MNKNSFSLIARIILIVIMLIGVVMWIMLASDVENESLIGANVNFGMWLAVIGFVLAIGSSVVSVILNPSSLKGMLIGVGAIVAIVAVAYGLADGTVLPSYKGLVDESTSKLVSTGLNSFYIVGLLAVLSVIYSGVARTLK